MHIFLIQLFSTLRHERTVDVNLTCPMLNRQHKVTNLGECEKCHRLEENEFQPDELEQCVLDEAVYSAIDIDTETEKTWRGDRT